MKLTGELKDKVEAVNTLEEKKDIIAQAGIELTDDELESVAGGNFNPPKMVTCPDCGHEFYVYFYETSITCERCGKWFRDYSNQRESN